MRLGQIRRRSRPKVGLVFSGGGAKGFAHVGVLKALERAGVPVDMLAGTSAGGVVASFRALGLTAAQMEERALWLSRWRNLVRLVDRADSRLGLFSAQKVADMLRQYLGETQFADLEIPLALVAVDFQSGQEVVLRQGCLFDAVRASSAYPGIFEPVEIGSRLLIDGGILNNLPCDVARDMGAEVVIAVDIGAGMDDLGDLLDSSSWRSRFLPHLNLALGTLSRSVAIMRQHLRQAKLQASPPDLLIRPDIPPGITTFRGFSQAAACMAAGERATEAALPLISAHLAGIVDLGCLTPIEKGP